MNGGVCESGERPHCESWDLGVQRRNPRIDEWRPDKIKEKLLAQTKSWVYRCRHLFAFETEAFRASVS